VIAACRRSERFSRARSEVLLNLDHKVQNKLLGLLKVGKGLGPHIWKCQ
jgi:hypothetical protein